MFENLLLDLRDAFRTIRKRPGFAAVVVLTLALGIGANTAIFSVVNSVLLRPLGFHDSERLYVIHEVIPQWTNSYPLLQANLPDFLIWQKDARSFDDIAITEDTAMILSGAGDAEQVRGIRASANFLDLLGVRPALGRPFRAEEDRPGHGQSVILSDSFWRNRFGGDRNLIGRAIVLDGAPYTVAGVLPANFQLPGSLGGFSSRMDVLVPLNGPRWYEQGLVGEFDFTAIGRLKPGVSPAQATAELNVIQARIAKEAGEKVDLRATLSPLQTEIVGPARQGLVLLLAAIAAVLLMICLNLANLLLARVPGRMREAGIRKALGASASRLVRQLLTESVLLATLGGGAGIVLAVFFVRWIANFGPLDLPRKSEIALDGYALGFAVLISATTALIFGAVPALRLARVGLLETLGSGGKSTTESRATRRGRSLLIGVQVATCTVLLVVAGLLSRSLLRLLNLNPGFNVEHTLAAEIELPTPEYKEVPPREAFYTRTLDELRRLPGVRSAAWIHILPLEGNGSRSSVALWGHTDPAEQLKADYRAISPDYFQAMEIPLVAGRVFNERDRGTHRIIITESLARRLFPSGNPLGQQCLASWGRLQTQPSEVIGVVGDVRTRLDRPPMDLVYVSDSWGQQTPGAPASAAIVVRSEQDPASLTSAVRDVIRRTGSSVPVVALRPMSRLVELNVEGRRFQMMLISGFAVSALLLAALGIFGVVAYSVEQRRREFGVRSALGAQRSDLLALSMRQGLAPVLLGLLTGVAASLAGGSLLQSFVFGLSPRDAFTFFAVSFLITVVAAAACYIPARRGMRVDPMVALRYE